VNEWLRRHPVTVFLPVQALLCFWNLGLLSPWMDEVISLEAMRLPLDGVLRAAAADVHPPGYYLLLFFWQRIPLGLNWAVQARALSVVFLLAATVAADRLWASGLPERARLGFLTLWTFSPCLLLYGRMCRSYSLQILVTIIAAACVRRFRESPSRRSGAALAAALSAGLYVHYVPGLAMLATANLLLLGRRHLSGKRFRDMLAIDAAVVFVYLPWIWKLGASLHSWSRHTATYAVTGSPWLEFPVKLAFWAMSFEMGEAVPDAAVAAGILVLPLLAILIGSGARRNPLLLGLALPLTVIGFIGVERWVGYPFVPARMLFVFPFLLLLLAHGVSAGRLPYRTGAVAMAAMCALSVNGIWCYFHKTDFRNKQYPMPMDEIAALIEQNSSAADSAILVDSSNSDPPALGYALGPARPFLKTGMPGAEPEVRRRLGDPRIRTIWFLRNTHDVSPEKLDARFEMELRPAMRVTVHAYEPFTPLELRLMRGMGMTDPPAYFHELLEFRR
jgi:hypothetical protein